MKNGKPTSAIWSWLFYNMKRIVKELIVQQGVSEVWWQWTTTEGLRSFFGANNKMELRVGGPFEIYFSMDAPEGSRGSEKCKVLSFLPEKMLSFSWNAPPTIPAIRKLGPSTWVVVELEEITQEQTKLTLSHLGWQEGADWDATYAYFDDAWSMVLGWFKESI